MDNNDNDLKKTKIQTGADTLLGILSYIGGSFKNLTTLVFLVIFFYLGYQLHWFIELGKRDPITLREFSTYNPELELQRQLQVDVILDSLLESTNADRSQVWLLHNTLRSTSGTHFNRSSIYTEKTRGVPRFIDQHQREILTRNVVFLDEILEGKCVVRVPDDATWTTRFMLVCPLYDHVSGFLGMSRTTRIHGYITLSYTEQMNFSQGDVDRLVRILGVHKSKIEDILSNSSR